MIDIAKLEALIAQLNYRVQHMDQNAERELCDLLADSAEMLELILTKEKQRIAALQHFRNLLKTDTRDSNLFNS